MVAKGVGAWGRMEWEFGVSRYKLLNIGWINNKALPYSIENYVHYHMINCNEKIF